MNKFELYKDKEDKLWIKEEDEEGPLYVRVTDVSKKLSLPKYTLLLDEDEIYTSNEDFKASLPKKIDNCYACENNIVLGFIYFKEKDIIKKFLSDHSKVHTLNQIRAFHNKWKWLLKSEIGIKKHRNGRY